MSDKEDQAPATAEKPRKFKPYSPAKFRAKSHDNAHADQAMNSHSHHPRVDHPLVTHTPPEFIDTQAGLDELIAHLRSAGRFAYDSEFIGELTYVPKLCLIQVASPSRVALVDPLAEIDLDPFWRLLADPSVEKIVHAGQQDIEPVHRHIGQRAANVFDTQIGAGFAGLAYPVALSKLVQHLVGARLGKGLTFTHWDQRPLSDMQLRYAGDDVRYLVAVADWIEKTLQTLGHADWAKAECDALCDPGQYQFDEQDGYLKIRGAAALHSRNQAVLRELSRWRDQVAREMNIPPRSLMRDEVMLDLARTPVKSPEKFAKVRGLPRPIEAEYGEKIIEMTLTALASPDSDLPRVRDFEPTPRQRFRSDAMWAAFQVLCSGRGVDSSIVASRQEVGEFFRQLDAGESAPTSRLLMGWRRELAGDPLQQLFAGKLQVTHHWKDSLITETETTKS